MHLYVVRHGETWANAEQRYLGSLDPGLTELGRQQAEVLGEYLPKKLDALVVSPRIRATETASILNEGLKLPVEIMACFRERNVGVFEGLTQADAREQYRQPFTSTRTETTDGSAGVAIGCNFN